MANQFDLKVLDVSPTHVQFDRWPLKYKSAMNDPRFTREIDWNQRLLDRAYWGDTAKIKECLNKGADVNYTEAKTGRTALHYACRYDDGSVEYFDTCILLINSGANVTSKSEYGRTALSLIQDSRRKAHLQKEANRYSTHTRLLQNANHSVDVVKLFLCGAPAAGKTTLKKTLTKKFSVPSFLRTPSSASTAINESLGAAEENYSRTPGIDVNKKVIRGAGTFWIWDCAGQMEYFLTHGMFLGSAQSVFVILFDLDKKLRGIETPLSTEYWLSFIKSVHIRSQTKPRVLLVATHLDRVKDQTEGMRFADNILKELQTMFDGELDIINDIFVLDGRLDSKGMQALKVALKKQWDDIRDSTLIPKYCDKLKKLLAPWREEHTPVLCWSDYRERVKEVYPVMEEDTLCAVTSYLQDMGELYLAEFPDREHQVILNIHWFTSEIIGSAFAGEEFLSHYKTLLPNQPFYTLEELSQFFSSKMDPTRLLALLEHMDLLHITKDRQYLLPGKLPTTMPDVYWSPSKAIIVKGRSIECVSKIDIINPTVFPCIQKKLLDMNLGSSMLSRSAVKRVVGSVELMVQITEDKRAINVAVLCNHGDSVQECYDILQDTTSLVQIELHQKSPGTETRLCYLSPKSLRAHNDLDQVWRYTSEHLRKAENIKGFLLHQGNPENISEVLFPGYDTIFLQENGIRCRYEWLPHTVTARCFKRLDMEHEWREDYRSVGEALRIPTYEIKQIADDAARCHESLTVNIIKAWCHREHRPMSIGMLRKLLTRLSLVDQVDALEAVDQVIGKYNRVSLAYDDDDVTFELGISENLARWRVVLKRLWRQPIKTDLDPSTVVSQLDFIPPDLCIIIQDTNTIEQRVVNAERLLQFLLQREQEDWPASFVQALRVTHQDPLANAIVKEYQGDTHQDPLANAIVKEHQGDTHQDPLANAIVKEYQGDTHQDPLANAIVKEYQGDTHQDPLANAIVKYQGDTHQDPLANAILKEYQGTIS